MARYDAILDQSERAHLFYHLSNTNIQLLGVTKAEERMVCRIRSNEGLTGVFGNKETWQFTFREQGIFLNNF